MWCDEETFPRVPDRRAQERREGEATEALGQSGPPAHGAGDGDRVPAEGRHGATTPEALARPAERGASGGVQSVEVVVVPDEREDVAAEPVHRRLDDRQGGGRGDGRVDGVSTLLEHREAGLRGERVRGGHHLPREDGRAMGEVWEVGRERRPGGEFPARRAGGSSSARSSVQFEGRGRWVHGLVGGTPSRAV